MCGLVGAHWNIFVITFKHKVVSLFQRNVLFYRKTHFIRQTPPSFSFYYGPSYSSFSHTINIILHSQVFETKNHSKVSQPNSNSTDSTMSMKNDQGRRRSSLKGIFKRVRKSRLSFGKSSSKRDKDQVLAQSKSVDTAESESHFDPIPAFPAYLLTTARSLDAEDTEEPLQRLTTPAQADTSISSQEEEEEDNAARSSTFIAATEVTFDAKEAETTPPKVTFDAKEAETTPQKVTVDAKEAETAPKVAVDAKEVETAPKVTVDAKEVETAPKATVDAKEAEVETYTNSIVVQLFCDQKTAPVSSSKPTLVLSAALLFMTLFVMTFGAYLEGQFDHVGLKELEMPPVCYKQLETPSFSYLQPTIETVGPQPTVDTLFFLTQEQVPSHIRQFNLQEVGDLLLW